MGNQSSSNIGVLLTFDKPYFYSGDTISGNLYLNLDYSHDISNISLTLVGKENTNWIPSSAGIEDRNRAKAARDEGSVALDIFLQPIIKSGEKFIFSMFSSLGAINASSGQYTFPFQFLLPQGLPSSFEYINEDINASICYYAELKVNRRSSPDLTFYKGFNIRQPPTSLNYSQEQNSSGEISDCCSSKGKASFRAGVSGSSFTWGDVAKCFMEINNTECQLNVKSIKATLTQKINIKNNSGETDYITRFICDVEVPVQCMATQTATSSIELRLSNSNNPTIQYSNRSINKTIYDSPSAIEKLNSTVKGNLISNEYFVVAEVLYDGVRCCDGPQSINFPVIIYPEPIPTDYTSFRPHNWNPQIMTSISLNPIDSVKITLPSISVSSNINASSNIKVNTNTGYDPFNAPTMKVTTNQGYDPFNAPTMHVTTNNQGYDPFNAPKMEVKVNHSSQGYDPFNAPKMEVNMNNQGYDPFNGPNIHVSTNNQGYDPFS